MITREYPQQWAPGSEPYYPNNTEQNNRIYQQYKKLASKEKQVVFGGRLGSYQYWDMDQTVHESLALFGATKLQV